MQLEPKLAKGEFVILAEMEPPKGADVSEMVGHALAVKGRVDGFVVPEMSSAVMRLSSLGGAMLLANRGLTSVMQVCCRDRNRLALQADLLAANALGIENVMAVTGDDITFGDHHKARPVNDLDLMELLGALKTLMSGRDLAGIELKGAPRFFVGALANTGAKALDLELADLDQKVAAGVRFFLTPPVFDLAVLERFQKRLAGAGAYLIPTVLLLKSVGMARYLDRHIEQVSVPAAVIDRLQKAPERVRECVAIAGELVAGVRDMGLSGVNLSTIGWEDKLPAVLAAAGL
jgi:5,10-methylenetetrahydrofolate reductase